MKLLYIPRFELKLIPIQIRNIGQYRIILNVSTRRQIFRQIKQKAQPILDVLASIFVKYGGKSASVMAFKAQAVNCAVLP
jgi:hypothetical protein